jgi:hypothetical protein
MKMSKFFTPTKQLFMPRHTVSPPRALFLKPQIRQQQGHFTEVDNGFPQRISRHQKDEGSPDLPSLPALFPAESQVVPHRRGSQRRAFAKRIEASPAEGSLADVSGKDATALVTVDRAMKMLGVDLTMMTNPKVINQLLDEMKLADFNPTLGPLREFLTHAKSSPQPLAPLLKAVRLGFVQHPAIMEFINLAITNQWLSPYDELQTTLNAMYLLQAFTIAMANNASFIAEIQDFILNKRTRYGIMPHSTLSTFLAIFRSTHRFFDSAKTISVDPAITYDRYLNVNHGRLLTVEEINELDIRQLLSFAEKKSLMSGTTATALTDFSGLMLNIYEATITEYKKGYQDNAFSGHVLNQVLQSTQPQSQITRGMALPKTMENNFRVMLSDENYYMKNNLSQDWINLYESWNMCFILSELNNLHILVPKLLIPSVLSAKKEDYIYTRIIALWLAINHYTMRQLDKIPEVAGPANRDEMVRAWGKINRKYADNLVRQIKTLSPQAVQDNYHKFFGMPDFSLLKLLISYGR